MFICFFMKKFLDTKSIFLQKSCFWIILQCITCSLVWGARQEPLKTVPVQKIDWKQRGAEFMKAQRYSDAVAAFEMLVQQEETAMSLCSLAEAKYRLVESGKVIGKSEKQKLFLEIISLCNKCLSKDKNCFPAMILRGYCKNNLGMMREAIVDYNLAKPFFDKKDPINSWSHDTYDRHLLGMLYFGVASFVDDQRRENPRNASYDDVIDYLSISLDLEPRYWGAYSLLAQMKLEQKDFFEAFDYAEIAIARSSRHPGPVFIQKVIFMELLMLPEALENIDEFSTDDGALSVYIYQGRVYLLAGKIPESIKCFSRVIKKSENIAVKLSALSYRKEAYQRLKEKQLAARDKKTLNELFEKRGGFTSSEMDLKKGIQQAGTLGSYNINQISDRSDGFYTLGFYDPCLADCKLIMEKTKPDSKLFQDACMKQSIILTVRGKPKEALESIRKLKTPPTSSVLYAKKCFLKSLASSQLGDSSNASAHRAKGLDTVAKALKKVREEREKKKCHP